ncbi:hypothetical protein Pd630_LPD09106 (plasmid) [Rhodococcus opacus PD630]|nr:hypothetical protein Pd630_LPD09106 [Rhodococcus opacus PD630]
MCGGSDFGGVCGHGVLSPRVRGEHRAGISCPVFPFSPWVFGGVRRCGASASAGL